MKDKISINVNLVNKIVYLDKDKDFVYGPDTRRMLARNLWTAVILFGLRNHAVRITYGALQADSHPTCVLEYHGGELETIPLPNFLSEDLVQYIQELVTQNALVEADQNRQERLPDRTLSSHVNMIIRTEIVILFIGFTNELITITLPDTTKFQHIIESALENILPDS